MRGEREDVVCNYNYVCIYNSKSAIILGEESPTTNVKSKKSLRAVAFSQSCLQSFISDLLNEIDRAHGSGI